MVEVALTLLALALLTVGSVMRLAPEFVNADVLLNSVMSLQNLTLFYWGQNRLLNVLPAMVWPLRDPGTNLLAVLGLAALAHWLLLLLLCWSALALAAGRSRSLNLLPVFLGMSACFLLVLRPQEVFNIAIWHVEYSLPMLLLGFCFVTALRTPMPFRKWLALCVACSAVAVGVNYAAMLPVLFASVAFWVYRRGVQARTLVLSLCCVLAFLLWGAIASAHGALPYGQFNPALLREGLPKVLRNLAGAFDSRNLAVAVLCLGAARIVPALLRPSQQERARDAGPYTSLALLVFSLGWLLLFSSNEWISANDFNYRYFTVLIYAGLLVGAMAMVRVLTALGRSSQATVGLASSASIVCALGSGFTPVDQYRVLQAVKPAAGSSGGLYAGDYWMVWPAVFSDMLAGHRSLGVGFRAEGNLGEVRARLLEQLQRSDAKGIRCLGESAPNCERQIRSIAGPFYLAGRTRVTSQALDLELVRWADQLRFHGQSFLELPSSAGIAVSEWRRSDGRAGCLFQGPSAPMRAGQYRLAVSGRVAQSPTATLEVVSSLGTVTHLRSPIRSLGADASIAAVPVDLMKDVDDLEVRLCVDRTDELTVTGYELAPR